jgi:hypothetical protein
MDQVGTIRELAMTTKELCDALRHTHPSRTMCKEAADVIERLTNNLNLANDGWANANSEILRLQSWKDEAEERLAPPRPDQTGGDSNAYYSNVASAKASPSYQHAPISKCRGLD